MRPTLKGSNPRPAELAWYRKHGKYIRERIVADREGELFVIGDWSWERLHPNKAEYIEDRMNFHKIYAILS